MEADDQVAQWLVQWEEAVAANRPPPALDQLPPELRQRGREGMRLLRGFARMSTGLAATVAPPPDDIPPTPPDTPRYRFEEFLARGGMGEVWRGRDLVLEREVALKVLRAGVRAGGGFKARFAEEARYVGQLQHPSIVPVYDMGELPDGRPFFVMKLIHGRTLADLLQARAMPAEELPRWIEVFEQVCAAVAFAHARGLIHRDLKPSNVMLGEFGEVLVMDWGIAKVLAASPEPAAASPTPVRLPGPLGRATEPGGPVTLPGQARGTPAFMSPEQARGEGDRVGKASDVFGLGGILCVILTGQPPYTQDWQVLAASLEEAFARLDASGADAELIRLARVCLAPEPEARFADAAEVAGRVKLYRDGVAARQRQAERGLWLQQVIVQAERATAEPGRPFPPAAETVRARLRLQALELLRAEVAEQVQRLSSADPDEVTAARQVLEHFPRLPALAGVRGPALANLPEPERQAWQTFWQDLEDLLQGPTPPR